MYGERGANVWLGGSRRLAGKQDISVAKAWFVLQRWFLFLEVLCHVVGRNSCLLDGGSLPSPFGRRSLDCIRQPRLFVVHHEEERFPHRDRALRDPAVRHLRHFVVVQALARGFHVLSRHAGLVFQKHSVSLQDGLNRGETVDESAFVTSLPIHDQHGSCLTPQWLRERTDQPTIHATRRQSSRGARSACQRCRDGRR